MVPLSQFVSSTIKIVAAILAATLVGCTMLPDHLQPPSVFYIPPSEIETQVVLPDPVPVDELLLDTEQDDECKHQFAVIKKRTVNLRASGTTESAILDKAKLDTRLLVIGQEANWIKVNLLDGRTHAWVREDLVTIECLISDQRIVTVDRLDLYWRSGKIFSGLGIALLNTNLLAQPSDLATVVEEVSAGQRLVIATVVEDEKGVFWAEVQARQPGDPPVWIRADLVRVQPSYLTEFFGSRSHQLGSRVQIATTTIALDNLPSFPPSDGGRLYDRDLWIPPSETDSSDRDSACDLTCRLLETTRLADGTWYLPWEDRTERDPSQLVAVPIVPLYEAHLSEGWRWSTYDRHTYAGPSDSRRVHVLISLEQRRRRGAADPAYWLPDTRVGQCRYAADWIRIKHSWGMTVDDAERASLQNILELCDDMSLIPVRNPVTGSVQVSGFAVDDQALSLTCDVRSELITITNPSSNVTTWQDGTFTTTEIKTASHCQSGCCLLERKSLLAPVARKQTLF